MLGKIIQRLRRRDLLASAVAANQLELLAMQRLAPLSGAYLPWSDSAMSPSALVMVLNEIVLSNRLTVVECGGGVSTLYIANLLRQQGGHLYTVEHDLAWVNYLEGQLDQAGLAASASVIHAPLIPSLPLGGAWYDHRVIASMLSGLSIDLLLVDGPPAYTVETQFARYPALPFFQELLNQTSAIVLDDIDRPGERATLARWEDELSIVFQRHPDQNIAIGRMGSSLHAGFAGSANRTLFP